MRLIASLRYQEQSYSYGEVKVRIVFPGSTTFVPIHDWAHTTVPTHVCTHTRLCPHTYVCAHTRTFVPTHDCAQRRLCPQTCVSTNACVHKRVWAQSCGLKYIWAQTCGLRVPYRGIRMNRAYPLDSCLTAAAYVDLYVVHVSSCSFSVSQVSNLALLVGYVA